MLYNLTVHVEEFLKLDLLADYMFRLLSFSVNKYLLMKLQGFKFCDITVKCSHDKRSLSGSSFPSMNSAFTAYKHSIEIVFRSEYGDPLSFMQIDK